MIDNQSNRLSYCWIAVDKDGTEKISNGRMFRRSYTKKGITRMVVGIMWSFLDISEYTKNLSKNARNKWADGWSTEDGNNLPFFGVTLPKGTIEKLIGRKMTWDDEPINLYTLKK